jgi:hypothetical protein
MITLLLRVGCPIMANPNIEFMPVKKKKGLSRRNHGLKGLS